MSESMVTADNVREAGIAASIATNPKLLPPPSIYFQDFNFGQTMWDAAFGNVDGGSVSGVGEAVSDVAINKVLEMEERKRKEDDPAKDPSMIVEAGEQQREAMSRMQARSAELGREIAGLESQFEKQFGDAWRETIANEVLDPDQIPECREGESMAAYRDRLEIALIAEMIDTNGNIKPDHQNSPYAHWAQAKFEKRELDERIEQRTDPNISEVEAAAIDNEIAQAGTTNQVIQSILEIDSSGQESSILSAETDSRRDDVDEIEYTSAANEAAGFLGPTLG